ncbi:type II toxin-antitoxin system VapC family toxin [Candidatus Peregrinibacteria bacterium]|nr:type II toxin-antitoxin system VapC family toxin [Candidatus Peregrinibacteria bacterium]MBI3816466.1 type II toxin-antitoxin system VapC family toxin [Candidatus Peregrinibacteria bacterium]
MNILLDAVAFIRMTTEPHLLSQRARELSSGVQHTLYLSAVSVAEIALRYRMGKLPLPLPPSSFVPQERLLLGVRSLPLDEESASMLESLPLIHNDPFDRLLICQALANDLTILTPDKHIRRYKVSTAW